MAKRRTDRSSSSTTRCSYGVDLAEGQKTGFYLDQRDNRRAAAGYFRDRRVLDMFCYSGGFSLNAVAHGGAREAIGYDASDKAVALARANAEINSVPNVRFEAADCFEALESLTASNEKFGAVILDPPKFARSRSAVDDALRAYHRINRLAVNVLEPDGILVTCSCSGHVLREDFQHMLLGVAEQTQPRHPDFGNARFRARSPFQRHVPGERVPEVLHLPRGVAAVGRAGGRREEINSCGQQAITVGVNCSFPCRYSL